MASEAGKGDKQRPTDYDKFSENFDRIFGKKGNEVVSQEEYDDATEEDEDAEEEICSRCSGSGEGMYDGSTCYKCHGSGVEPSEKEDEI